MVLEFHFYLLFTIKISGFQTSANKEIVGRKKANETRTRKKSQSSVNDEWISSSWKKFSIYFNVFIDKYEYCAMAMNEDTIFLPFCVSLFHKNH